MEGQRAHVEQSLSITRHWNLQHLQGLVERETMGLCQCNDSCVTLGH